MKNSKKGYTLVELIIVVAIMAVFLAVIGVTFNTVFTNKAKGVSKNIYNMLGTAQTVGMSKDNVYFILTCDDGAKSVGIAQGTGTDLKVQQSKELDNKVSVKMILADGSERELADGNGIALSFTRSTGSIHKCFSFSNGVRSATELSSKVSKIIINQSISDFEITLSYTNGKFFYE